MYHKWSELCSAVKQCLHRIWLHVLPCWHPMVVFAAEPAPAVPLFVPVQCFSSQLWDMFDLAWCYSQSIGCKVQGTNDSCICRPAASHRLVPGDVVVLLRGKATCDMVLLQGSCLVEESMLSGEVRRQGCSCLLVMSASKVLVACLCCLERSKDSSSCLLKVSARWQARSLLLAYDVCMMVNKVLLAWSSCLHDGKRSQQHLSHVVWMLLLARDCTSRLCLGPTSLGRLCSLLVCSLRFCSLLSRYAEQRQLVVPLNPEP